MSLLQVNQLTGGYTRNPVLKDISFEIDKHSIVGLIGLNGAGKSTTIRHVIGLMEPHKGRSQSMAFRFRMSLRLTAASSLLFLKHRFCTKN